MHPKWATRLLIKEVLVKQLPFMQVGRGSLQGCSSPGEKMCNISTHIKQPKKNACYTCILPAKSLEARGQYHLGSDPCYAITTMAGVGDSATETFEGGGWSGV